MEFEIGRKFYLYEPRAELNVCCAHVLAILPHPEKEDNSLIVYRWYGRYSRCWRYGITDAHTQDEYMDYREKAEKKLKARTDGRHKQG